LTLILKLSLCEEPRFVCLARAHNWDVGLFRSNGSAYEEGKDNRDAATNEEYILKWKEGEYT
jgi:hypothetical protein